MLRPREYLHERPDEYDSDSKPRRSDNRSTKYRRASKNLECVLKCLATSLNFGTVFIFPCCLYANDLEGSVFLIVYCFISYVLTKPVYMMELVLGQFSAVGTMDMFYMICPALVGIGMTQIVSCCFIMSYFGGIMAYLIYYIPVCWKSVLPWTYCRQSWATCINDTARMNSTNKKFRQMETRTAAESFFRYEVLMENVFIEDGVHLPNLELLLTLIISWFLVFAILFRGIRRLHFFQYTVCVLMLIYIIFLFVMSLYRKGSSAGIMQFFRFSFEQFFDVNVWYYAMTLSFFTLGIAYGSLTTMASFEEYGQNLEMITTANILCEIFLSVLCGVTCYSWLGSVAHDMKLAMKKDVSGRAITMPLVVYPYALSKLWIPQLFATCFFVLIILLGALNIVYLMVVLTSQALDYFVDMSERVAYAFGCILGFLLGVIYTTPEGVIFLNIVDNFMEFLSLVIVGLLEDIVIQLYGLRFFAWDMEFLTGRVLARRWFLSLRILVPLFLAVLYGPVIWKMTHFAFTTTKNTELAVGLALFLLGFLPIPILFIIVVLIKWRQGNWRNAFSSINWYPLDLEEEYREFKREKLREYKKHPRSRCKRFFDG